MIVKFTVCLLGIFHLETIDPVQSGCLVKLLKLLLEQCVEMIKRESYVY